MTYMYGHNVWIFRFQNSGSWPQKIRELKIDWLFFLPSGYFTFTTANNYQGHHQLLLTLEVERHPQRWIFLETLKMPKGTAWIRFCTDFWNFLAIPLKKFWTLNYHLSLKIITMNHPRSSIPVTSWRKTQTQVEETYTGTKQFLHGR